jgi:hypothetical protein
MTLTQAYALGWERGDCLADGSASGSGGLSPEASADRDPGGAGGPQADTHLGEVVLARAVSAYRDALGSRLIAGYALGSLAHGGFSPLVSDVDLGLILPDLGALAAAAAQDPDLQAVNCDRLAASFRRWRAGLLA